MPTLTLTDDQMIELVKQLPPTKQAELFQFLQQQQQEKWEQLSRAGQGGCEGLPYSVVKIGTL